MQNFVSKKLCWFMIFILIFMLSGITEYQAFAQQKTEYAQEELKQVVDKLERLFNALENTLDEMSHDSFDPEAIIQEVGKDPKKLFEWVRDNTSFVPYSGTLRGPIGVLMDRLGNSLDKSLLLGRLLELAGQSIRLAHATMSKSKAEEIMNEISQTPIIPWVTKQKELTPINEFIKKYADEFNLNVAELNETFNFASRRSEKLKKEAIERTLNQTRILTEMIRTPLEAKELPINEKNKSIKAISDHWWVQWEREGTWVDLDSSLPHGKLGEAISAAADTHNPAEIPEDLYHTVIIKVIIERWEKGILKEEKALEHTLVPSKLIGEQINLIHYPVNLEEEYDLVMDEDALERLRTSLLDQKEWLPALNVGNDQITACSFKDTGETNDNPGKQTKGGGITGGVLGAFGGGRETKEESHLTAEWIEYEIKIPAEQNKIIRREIFDLIGPAFRKTGNTGDLKISEDRRLGRVLSILQETEIFLQACQLSSDYVIHLMGEKMTSNKNILLELLSNRDIQINKDLMEQVNKLVPLPGPEYSLALARQEWKSFHNGVYLNQPNVLNFNKGIRQVTQNSFTSYKSIDIVHNDIAVMPSSNAESFQVRLEQGVLDTNAEALLLSGLGDRIENTSEIFDQARVEAIDFLVIRNTQDPNWQKIQILEDVRTRIEHDLEKGYIVIIPERQITINEQQCIGWWRIDPRTGNTLGMVEKGHGQALTTRAVIMLGTLFAYGGYAECVGIAAMRRIAADKRYETHQNYEQYQNDLNQIETDFIKCLATNGIGGAGLMITAIFWPMTPLAFFIGGAILLISDTISMQEF